MINSRLLAIAGILDPSSRRSYSSEELRAISEVWLSELQFKGVSPPMSGRLSFSSIRTKPYSATSLQPASLKSAAIAQKRQMNSKRLQRF